MVNIDQSLNLVFISGYLSLFFGFFDLQFAVRSLAQIVTRFIPAQNTKSY
jgi:hypothetical protein